MKLECQGCGTRYTIDDAIIPPQGAKIRCRKCSAVIAVPSRAEGPSGSAAPPPAAAPPAPAPVVPPTPEPITQGSRFSVSPELHRAPAGAPAQAGPGFSFQTAEAGPRPAASPGPAPAAPPPATVSAPPPAPATGGSPPPEEKARHEKARRLARVLASDIAIYNKEKKERGLADGNLVAVLGYEIKKSWEIYKERVGPELANGTPYFRDALNDLLAEGKKIF